MRGDIINNAQDTELLLLQSWKSVYCFSSARAAAPPPPAGEHSQREKQSNNGAIEQGNINRQRNKLFKKEETLRNTF
jgi:hypothetical protein